MTKKTRKCPVCDDGFMGISQECGFCKGTGRVSIAWYMRYVREFKYQKAEEHEKNIMP